MRKQCKSEVKFIQEKFQVLQRAPARRVWRGVQMWPLEMMVPFGEAASLDGEVGRSQAALQEGKVEALRVTTFQMILLKEQRGQAYTFAHCSAPGASSRKISSLSFLFTEDS